MSSSFSPCLLFCMCQGQGLPMAQELPDMAMLLGSGCKDPLISAPMLGVLLEGCSDNSGSQAWRTSTSLTKLSPKPPEVWDFNASSLLFFHKNCGFGVTSENLLTQDPRSSCFFPVIFKNSYSFVFHMQDHDDLLPHAAA